MPEPSELQDVIDQALDLVEMTDATGSSGFAVTDRLQDWFNIGMSRLHYILAAADNSWFCSTAEITVTASTRQYALPDGGTLYSGAPKFYKMRDLYLVESGKIYTVTPFYETEISGWESTGPTVGGTLRMEYIPAYQKIRRGEWGTRSIPGSYPDGWEDYVAMFIARRLALKDENYERAMELNNEKQEALAVVLQNAGPRNVGRVSRVQDVTGRWEQTTHESVNYWYRLFGNYLEIGQPAALP